MFFLCPAVLASFPWQVNEEKLQVRQIRKLGRVLERSHRGGVCSAFGESETAQFPPFLLFAFLLLFCTENNFASDQVSIVLLSVTGFDI